MSRSPLGSDPQPGGKYFDSFFELAKRIRQGASFSGRERNCAFLNLGGESFADASAALGLDLEQDGRGIALCDWDHDGDVDLWMSNRTAPRLQFMLNQSAAGGRRSVAFLLEGSIEKLCPRDAAGARLVLSAGGSERVQTVHLGDGFLSQSSRWLHFGLGAIEMIDRVVVHWPAGEAELFVGVTSGGRFVLEQGTGKAVPATGKSSETLAAGELALPEPTETARIWLSEPADLPADLMIPNLSAGPAVLNLWASWCAPCIAELEAFAAVDGLPLVPINIENLDGDGAISEKKMRSILRSLGFEQAGGFADAGLVGALNKVVTDNIYRHRKLPLPASFLLDKDHRVRAIYKGPVDVATLRADLQQLGDQKIDHRDAAVPFPGRWSDGIFKSNPIAVANTYRRGGYDEDAREYLKNSLSTVGGGGPGAKLRLADVYMKLGDLERGAEDYEAAISNYQEALAQNPALLPARIFLTLSLADAGRSEEALQLVAKLRAASPGNPNFLNLEADVHRSLGDDAGAVEAYRAVLAINRRYIPAIEALTSILATSSDAEVRDATGAIEMAGQLSAVPGMRSNPRLLNTSADAYAEGGDFSLALREAENALKLMLPYGEDGKIRLQRERIERSKQRKALHAKPD